MTDGPEGMWQETMIKRRPHFHCRLGTEVMGRSWHDSQTEPLPVRCARAN